MSSLSQKASLTVAGVSIDELLLLMRLADVSDLRPNVLAIHPNVYRPEDQEKVDLAVFPGLLSAGLVSEHGAIEPVLKRWLRALQNPDAEIALRVLVNESALRGALVRHGKQVVCVFRHDDEVTLQGWTTDGDDFDGTVVEPLWRVLGHREPADFDSVTLGAVELSEIVAAFDPTSEDQRNEMRFRSALREYEVSHSAADILIEASRYSGRRTEIVYTRLEDSGIPKQASWAIGVMDTFYGRVLSTTTRGRHGELDVTLSPGTRRRFAEGLTELVTRGGCTGWFDEHRS